MIEILKKKADAIEKLEEIRLAEQTYEFISSIEPNKVEIKSKIQELFADKERAKKIGENVFSKVQQYDWSNVGKQYLEVYSSLE